MAEDRLKFRCYRCNQLLSASRVKAGTVIDCPRCKTKLEVPRSEPEPARAVSKSAPRMPQPSHPPLPSFMEEIAAAIPEDLAALRPEDIRVEAEFADLVVTATPDPPPLEGPPEPPPVEEPPLPKPTPAPPAAEVIAAASLPTNTGIETVLPAITIEPASILPPGHEVHSVREVVLQPATVLAWSLLVLMSIPMAFVAGLLLGHFVWK